MTTYRDAERLIADCLAGRPAVLLTESLIYARGVAAAVPSTDRRFVAHIERADTKPYRGRRRTCPAVRVTFRPVAGAPKEK